MYKTASFTVLIVSAMVLFVVSAYAAQENNTTGTEKISALNNTTVNNTDTNITGTNFAAINNTVAIGAAVSEHTAAKNNTSMNSAALNTNNTAAVENDTPIEQRNASMKEPDENKSTSSYDIGKYSTIKPQHNISTYSNTKGSFNVGGNSESSPFNTRTVGKPGLDVSKNASEHTFDLGPPPKPIVETSKFPFMCNIV